MLLFRQITGEINCVSDSVRRKKRTICQNYRSGKGGIYWNMRRKWHSSKGDLHMKSTVRLGDAKDKVISYRNRLTQECHYLHSCGWIFSHLDITQNLWAISWPFYLFAISSHTKKTKKKDCVPGEKTLYLSELSLVYKGFP